MARPTRGSRLHVESGLGTRSIAPLAFTPLMKKRLTRRAATMIERALVHFPELQGKTITVGLTRKHLGSASISYRAGAISRLTIRLRVRKVSYQTIGHELTHLVQGLRYGDRSTQSAAARSRIPSGEKQCDIWTLARHPLFCDDPPTYLKLPRMVRDQWPRYADSVRALCLAAIEKRPSHRLYIRWLESEIRLLTRSSPKRKSGEQMELPFEPTLPR
ncbi:MAG TPA: hypothetical protein VEG60_28585 [Candidatus Binatia bacterium]|nr:hypothetical protein [Candidatus Binatia bacterium]